MRKIGFALASLLMPALLGGGPSGGWLGASALAAAGDTLMVTGDGVNVRYGPSPTAKVRMRVYHDQLVTELERQGDWVRAEIAGSDGLDGWIHASLLALPTPQELDRARRRAVEPPGGLPVAKPPAPPSAATMAPPQPAPPATPPAPTAESPTAESPTAAPAPGDSASAAASSADTAIAAPAKGELESTAPAATEPAPIEPAAGPADAAEAADLARFRDSVDYLNSRWASVAGVDLFEGVQAVGGGVVQVGATNSWSTIPPASQQSYANALLDRWAAARGYSGPVSVRIVDPEGHVLLENKKP